MKRFSSVYSQSGGNNSIQKHYLDFETLVGGAFVIVFIKSDEIQTYGKHVMIVISSTKSNEMTTIYDTCRI